MGPREQAERSAVWRGRDSSHSLTIKRGKDTAKGHKVFEC